MDTLQQSFFRARYFIIALVVVSAAVAWYVSATATPQYAASLSLTVNRVNKKATADYEYDGYYAIQASDLVAQTVLSWFLTPSTLLEFYERAGLDARITSLSGVVGRFHARKYAAQNIVVQFSDAEKARAEKLANAIGDVVQERGEALNKDAEGKAIFDVVPAKAVIVERRPNVPLTTTAAAVVALLIGLVSVAGLSYLRGENAHRG